MIGSDFPKIEFQLFGWDLLEPMALITDTVMALLAIMLAIFLARIKSNHPFRTYWIWFFLVFGVGAFLGGLGHAFFNYWGVAGKFPSWIFGPVSIYLIEQGVIAAHWDEKKLSLYKLLSFWKLVLVFVAFTLVCIFAPIAEKPQLPFLPIAVNTIIGVVLTAGILGRRLAKKVAPEFKYFPLGVLILLPSAFIFLLKINLHPWFDKNDFSHILMMIAITYFYLGAKRSLPKLEKSK